MNEQPRFRPGQTIVIRDLVQGKVWAARPFITVRNTPELLASYMPTGAVGKHGAANAERITPAQRSRAGWVLRDEVWSGHGRIRLTIPGQKYSVLLFWNLDDRLDRWYINLEEPLIRTDLGFDCYDQILDVIVTPDLTSWHWEDEDELEEAVAVGLMSAEKAAALYEDGKTAVALLQSGKSIFNGWENWRPDPSWPVPVLAEGWDIE